VAVAAETLDVRLGDVVEIEARRYDVMSVRLVPAARVRCRPARWFGHRRRSATHPARPRAPDNRPRDNYGRNYDIGISVVATRLELDVQEVSRRLSELAAEVERLQKAAEALRASAAAREERVSPSVPLDAPAPSASLVVSDDAYDAFVERLEQPPAPNERLRRTMLGRSTERE
jgi:uncharacterized protein (DUF1778 family)